MLDIAYEILNWAQVGWLLGRMHSKLIKHH